MRLGGLLPRSLPTTYGTPELVDKARASGYTDVQLLVPPVDLQQDSPDAVSSTPFRERYGIRDNDITVVTVSRLDRWLKADSLLRTVDVIRTLGRDLPLRFVIVGDGDVRTE